MAATPWAKMDNNNDPDKVSNGKQAARKGFPRRAVDQKSTPVNVSTYNTQRRDKEKKMKMRTTYPAAQHDKNKNDLTRKPRRTQKCNDFLAQLRMTSYPLTVRSSLEIWQSVEQMESLHQRKDDKNIFFVLSQL